MAVLSQRSASEPPVVPLQQQQHYSDYMDRALLAALQVCNNTSPGTGSNFTSNALCNSTLPDSDLFGNTTTHGNLTGLADSHEPLTHAIVMGVTSVVLGLIILITIIGNVFVIAAILLERNLQNVANYLIVSLAVADLMVACLVMPLGAVYEEDQLELGGNTHPALDSCFQYFGDGCTYDSSF